MGLMDFEARGSQGPQAILEGAICLRRVPATLNMSEQPEHHHAGGRRTPDDEATKKGANHNSGDSDEKRI